MRQRLSSDDTETAPDDGAIGETWARPEPGTRLGRYALIEELGAGGMGVVYAAHDETLGRDVALKLIRPRSTQSHTAQARFEQEARLLAAVQHPAVVEIYDVGRHAGRSYLVMPRLPGETLRDWLQTPRSRADILGMFRAVAAGLAAAHTAGVVHCDFKPDNVLLDAAGLPKVADFGLARLDVPETQDDAETARSGQASGTPAYMAPELHRGAAPSIASDLYAFHVALFEALTGARPFRGGGLLEKKLRGLDPASAAKLPRSLRRRFALGLDPDPAQRPRVFAVQSASHRWRRLGAGLVAGVLALGVGAALMPATQQPCDAKADKVVGESATWGKPAENDAARATITHVHGRLNDWRRGWRAEFMAACKAGDQDRSRCLTKARISGESWMQPPRAGPTELARAMRWSQRLSALPQIDECGAPDGPASSAFVADLAEIRFSLDRGHTREAIAQGLAVAARAGVQSDATARFAAEILAAEAMGDLRQFERSETLLRDVVAAAEATARWRSATEAAIQLIWTVGVGGPDPEAAVALTKQADAYALRANDVRLQVAARTMLSGALATTGHRSEARDAVEEALALAREHGDTPGVAELRAVLVARRVSLAAMGNDTATVLDSAAWIESVEREQGPFAGAVLASRSALAHARGLAGQFDLSVDGFDEVALRYAAMGDGVEFWVHQMGMNAAQMELRAQRPQPARDRLEVACPAMAALRSPTHTNVLLCSLALQRARAQTGAPVSFPKAMETLGVIEARFDAERVPVQQARVAVAGIAVAVAGQEEAEVLLSSAVSLPALQVEMAWLQAESEAQADATKYEAVCSTASPTLRPDLCLRALERLGKLSPAIDVAARKREFLAR